MLYKYWDSKRECVKPAHPNAVNLNNDLREWKRQFEERRDVLEQNGQAYTALDLFEYDDGDVGVESSQLRFSSLMDRYLSDSGLRATTQKSYDYAAGVFYRYFGGDIFCEGLRVSQMKDFARWMSESGICDGSIHTILSKVYCVLGHGQEKGILMDVPYFPFRKEFHSSKRLYCLTEDVVRKVFRGLGGYELRYDDLNGVSGALCSFCSMCLRNGIAPVDYSMLRSDNVKEVDVDGVKYWKVEYNREKTGKHVKALLRKDDRLVEKLFGRFVEGCGSRDGYIFPMYTDKNLDDGDDLKMKARINTKFGLMKKQLLKWFDKENISVDRKELCYYTVRHTYASVYANKPGASLRGLATLMGRNVSGIETYVHQLGEDSDLIKAAGVVQF